MRALNQTQYWQIMIYELTLKSCGDVESSEGCVEASKLLIYNDSMAVAKTDKKLNSLKEVLKKEASVKSAMEIMFLKEQG